MDSHERCMSELRKTAFESLDLNKLIEEFKDIGRMAERAGLINPINLSERLKNCEGFKPGVIYFTSEGTPNIVNFILGEHIPVTDRVLKVSRVKSRGKYPFEFQFDDIKCEIEEVEDRWKSYDNNPNISDVIKLDKSSFKKVKR